MSQNIIWDIIASTAQVTLCYSRCCATTGIEKDVLIVNESLSPLAMSQWAIKFFFFDPQNWNIVLPTNELNLQHGDIHTTSSTCDRCKLINEDWIHLWDCDKNENALHNILVDSIKEWITTMDQQIF